MSMMQEAPLWQRVLNPTTMLELQVPDIATAADFWRMYNQTPQEFTETLRALDAIGVPGLPAFSENDIRSMIPGEKWYLKTDHGNGIHGRQHEFRVGVYAQVFAHKLGLSADDRKILKAASLIHDIGRTKDYPEPTHGQQSVDRWRDLGDILKGHAIELNPREEYIVKAICIHHEKLYEDIPGNDQAKYYLKIPEEIKKDERLAKLLRVFMAADALDRYRSPKEEWWPDPVFFSHDPEVQQLFVALMPFARQFTLWSEYYRLSYPGLSLENVFTHVTQDPEFGLVIDEPDETQVEASERRLVSAK